MNKKLIKIFLCVWLAAFAVMAAICLFVPREAYPETLLRTLIIILITPMLAFNVWKLANYDETKKAVNWLKNKFTFKKKYE